MPAVDVPKAIQAKLHEHQKDGLRWMVHMYQNGMPIILVSLPGEIIQKRLHMHSLTCGLYASSMLNENTSNIHSPVGFVVPATMLKKEEEKWDKMRN